MDCFFFTLLILGSRLMDLNASSVFHLLRVIKTHSRNDIQFHSQLFWDTESATLSNRGIFYAEIIPHNGPNSLILYGKYLEVPGSPTGFKLINLLTPTPSDNRDGTYSSHSLSGSLSLFLPLSASSYKLAEASFVTQYTQNESHCGPFSCANAAKKNGAGAAWLSEVPPVSLYLHALLWDRNLLDRGLIRRKVKGFPCASLRTKVPESSEKSPDRCCWRQTHTMSLLPLLICISSGWKQTSLIGCQLGIQ